MVVTEGGENRPRVRWSARLALGVVWLSSMGCSLLHQLDSYTPWDAWDLPEEIRPQSVDEALRWAIKIQQAETDREQDGWWDNFVQTPAETHHRGAGDCEDRALYLMELLKRYQKGSTDGIRMVVGRVWQGTTNGEREIGHAWVEYHGAYLDPGFPKGEFRYRLKSVTVVWTYEEVVTLMREDNSPVMNFRSLR